MNQGETSPPSLLTESDLIALMEKHGIGEHSSMHIPCKLQSQSAKPKKYHISSNRSRVSYTSRVCNTSRGLTAYVPIQAGSLIEARSNVTELMILVHRTVVYCAIRHVLWYIGPTIM